MPEQALVTLPKVGDEVNYFTKVSPSARIYSEPTPARIVRVKNKYTVSLELIDKDAPKPPFAPDLTAREELQAALHMNDDGSLQPRSNTGYGGDLHVIDSVNKREAAPGQDSYWDYKDGTLAAPPWERDNLGVQPIRTTGGFDPAGNQFDRATLGADAIKAPPSTVVADALAEDPELKARAEAEAPKAGAPHTDNPAPAAKKALAKTAPARNARAPKAKAKAKGKAK